MGKRGQTLAIAAASLAILAGLYVVLAVKGSKGSAVSVTADASHARPQTRGHRLADPLEPATRGLVECHDPNEQRKTCRAMTRYEALGQGRYRDSTVALVSSDGPALLEVSLPVEVKAGAVCATMTPSTFAEGKLLVAGRPLGPQEAAPFLAAVTGAAQNYMNREVCTSHISSSGELAGLAAIDGVPYPDLNVRLKWVHPDDGYTVGP